jgi:hypothetical protein
MKNRFNRIADVTLADCKQQSSQSGMDLYRKIENL